MGENCNFQCLKSKIHIKIYIDVSSFDTPQLWVVYLHYDDVLKWKHFPCYWPFARSPVNSPEKAVKPKSAARAHDDVIKWKRFLRYWPFVRGIHRSPVNSPHKGQWRGALVFSLICAGINGWVNNREAGDLRRHLAHYGVTVMSRYMFAYCVSLIHTIIHMIKTMFPRWNFVPTDIHSHIDGLVHERRNTSTLATELRLSCTNPSI